MLLPLILFGLIVSRRREALALQEKCAQECTAAYRWVKIVQGPYALLKDFDDWKKQKLNISCPILYMEKRN